MIAAKNKLREICRAFWRRCAHFRGTRRFETTLAKPSDGDLGRTLGTSMSSATIGSGNTTSAISRSA